MGELGDGTSSGRYTPVYVAGLEPKLVSGIAELPNVESASFETGGSPGPGAAALFGEAAAITVGAVALGGMARYIRRCRAC